LLLRQLGLCRSDGGGLRFVARHDAVEFRFGGRHPIGLRRDLSFK
jgi:hypothetical protein